MERREQQPCAVQGQGQSLSNDALAAPLNHRGEGLDATKQVANLAGKVSNVLAPEGTIGPRDAQVRRDAIQPQARWELVKPAKIMNLKMLRSDGVKSRAFP